MTIGAGVFLAVIGATLRYAVTDNMDGVDLRMIGLILMVAGIVGAIVAAFAELNRRRRVVPTGTVLVDDRDRRVI